MYFVSYLPMKNLYMLWNQIACLLKLKEMNYQRENKREILGVANELPSKYIY